MRKIVQKNSTFTSTLVLFHPEDTILCCTQLRAFFFLLLLLNTLLLQRACVQLTSASLYQLVLLVIGRMALLIREYTALIGDPIAVQILTHNPSLSSISRYSVAFELPRAEARHHQPDLPRAPIPRAFAHVSSLPITIHPNIRYCTYLGLLFNTAGEEIPCLYNHIAHGYLVF